MNGGGGHAPPPNSGEFLLQLLQKPHNSDLSSPLSLQTFSHDPAVAAVGPTVPTFLPPHAVFQSNSRDLRLWDHSPPPFAPHNYFQQNPNLNPEFSSPPVGFSYSSDQVNPQATRSLLVEEPRKFGSLAVNSKPSLVHQDDQNIIFGSINRDVFQSAVHQMNSFGTDGKVRGKRINRGKQVQSGNYGSLAPPPGFSSKRNNGEDSNYRHGRKTSDHNAEKGRSNFHDLGTSSMPFNKACSIGQLTRSSSHSTSAVYMEESRLELHGEDGEDGQESRDGELDKISGDRERNELDDLENHLVASLGLEETSGEKKDTKNNRRDKDYRSDNRGQWIMGQRMRNQKSCTACPKNIHRLNIPFLALFESLIPADEEKLKQKQLMTLLENVVSREWPDARLHVYGSCANSFGFPKSDIDVCLVLELGTAGKSNVLLKLADMLLSENLENVQALTRARVPVVKLMDPVTSISCDICVNNSLAVVNTKLLRDYAKIDVRLRQLAFIVKHWAKSRGVNETYHGTLSSYAYVLMCIYFLQQRRPAILPCLQGMERTYCATVENIDCAFFDQVEKLQNFGSRNGESIAQLVWGFFHYWAYCHDFANDVISVRCGRTISKRDKDWTRRVGNDRHLICIEDPFEISHDLGRVVDKFSIRVLREEFERAAHIMQNDPNPCVTLFEPYVSD